jgi:hypothetical protein
LSFRYADFASQLFEIRDGKIDQIGAVINTVPYGMASAIRDK